MVCLHQTLIQVRIWVLFDKRKPRLPTKWPALISLLLWTRYLSHLLPDCFQIPYMDYFYQTLAQVQIWSLSDKQDGHHLSVCTCGHSTLIIYNLISSKFHVWTTIKLLFMSEYEFCLMNDNHDCRQNGYPFFTAGH